MLRQLPNLLTISRILVIPVMVAAFYFDDPLKYWVAASLFLYASVTDFFDGYLARKMEVVSKVGKFLDPIADKLLVGVVIVLLVWDGNAISRWDLLPMLAILMREILVSGLREFLAELRVKKMKTTKLAKLKTGVQMFALGFLLWAPALSGYYIEELARIALWLAAVLTLITGYSYLVSGLQHIEK